MKNINPNINISDKDKLLLLCYLAFMNIEKQEGEWPAHNTDHDCAVLARNFRKYQRRLKRYFVDGLWERLAWYGTLEDGRLCIEDGKPTYKAYSAFKIEILDRIRCLIDIAGSGILRNSLGLPNVDITWELENERNMQQRRDEIANINLNN